MAPGKRLVVCFDGTWNAADAEDNVATNVQRIARAIPRSGDDGIPQIVLYLRGVGTTGGQIERWLDGATGDGVDDNIRAAYMFLAQNYDPGDRTTGTEPDAVYLFGFSRGAFTARSLAGFIASAGLLKRGDLDKLAAAWAHYRTSPEPTPTGFCDTTGASCHTEFAIEFLGVWDTVGSLGVPDSAFGFRIDAETAFHDTSPSNIVAHACHALAIDEHRDAFVPTLWTGQPPRRGDVEQVWFAGVHSDVGGGYDERALADIPLRWMADKAASAGLHLDEGALPAPGDLDPLAPQHRSQVGLFAADRIRPTHRQIEGAAFETDCLEKQYYPHDAEGRRLPTVGESVHPSARDRLRSRVGVIAEHEAEEPIVYSPKNLVAALAD